MDLNYLKPLLEKKSQELGYELVELSSRKEKGPGRGPVPQRLF